MNYHDKILLLESTIQAFEDDAENVEKARKILQAAHNLPIGTLNPEGMHAVTKRVLELLTPGNKVSR